MGLHNTEANYLILHRHEIFATQGSSQYRLLHGVPFVTWRGNEGRPGAAFYRGALKDSKFPSESSRVRGLPVARLLSGSNHILKGFLTRNTSMKKYIAPVPLGGTVFRGGSGCFMFEDLNTSKESGEVFLAILGPCQYFTRLNAVLLNGN